MGSRRQTLLGSGIDAGAYAYLTAAGISNGGSSLFAGTSYERTGAQIWTAINNRFQGIKDAGLQGLVLGWWPCLGATTAANKLNAKDPRDLDAAYRLVLYGSPTPFGGGMAWNGTTQYADTLLVPSVAGSLTTGMGLYYYSRSNALGGDCYDMGAVSSGSATFALSGRNNAGGSLNDVAYCKAFTIDQYVQESNAAVRGLGLYSVNRQPAVTTNRLTTNGTLLSAGSGAGTLPTRSVLLGATGIPGGVYGNSPHTMGEAAILLGASATQEAAWDSLAISCLTALGRNV